MACQHGYFEKYNALYTAILCTVLLPATTKTRDQKRFAVNTALKIKLKNNGNKIIITF